VPGCASRPSISHEVFRQAEVIEGLLQDLAACCAWRQSTLQALLGFEVTPMSGFACFLAHRLAGDMVCSGVPCRALWLQSAQAHATQGPLRICASGVTSSSRLQDFPLSFVKHGAVYIRLHGLSHSHTVFCLLIG